MLGLVLFFPLGLLMLWTSPRSLQSKAETTAIVLALVAVAGFALVTSDAYNRLVVSRANDQIYDFTVNERGRYRTPQILQFEREIFGAVVSELRHASTAQTDVPLEEQAAEDILRGTVAFERVAEEYGLDPEDVAGIYNKVSRQLAEQRK